MPRQLRYTPGDMPQDFVHDWLERPALRQMVEAFGGEWPRGDLASRLTALIEFSAVWDRRNGGSRLDIDNGVATDEEQVFGWADELGLVTVAEPTRSSYDMVLVLGGLVSGCVARVNHLATLLGSGQIRANKVALLGSFRELLPGEGTDASRIAADLGTEVDVLMALSDRLARDDHGWSVDIAGDRVAEPRQAQLIARRPGDPELWCFAARSSDPVARPANTADTYRQAAKELHLARRFHDTWV